MIELRTSPAYDAEKIKEYFEQRGWKVVYTPVTNIDLIIPHRGAAIECYDGRHANRRILEIVQKEGPKIPGGLNGVAALKTGGSTIGFSMAALAIAELGYRAGTHKECGFFELWSKGELESAKYPLELPKYCTEGEEDNLGRWIQLKIRHLGGKHFHLPGVHEEEALIFNPFINLTPVSRNDRFSYDHWLMQLLGIKGIDAAFMAAEVIEKLRPDYCRVAEILVP